MTERPILFSAPMVLALLAGEKTQTRRVVKLPDGHEYDGHDPGDLTVYCSRPDQPTGEGPRIRNRYGIRGDRLYVRETWRPIAKGQAPGIVTYGTAYKADNAVRWQEGRGTIIHCDGPTVTMSQIGDHRITWKPSIHMDSWRSRITLDVISVRVERLQDISGRDAIAEGIPASCCPCEPCGRTTEMCPADQSEAIMEYRGLWASINGAESWNANPWVWVIEFKRVAADGCGEHGA